MGYYLLFATLALGILSVLGEPIRMILALIISAPIKVIQSVVRKPTRKESLEKEPLEDKWLEYLHKIPPHNWEYTKHRLFSNIDSEKTQSFGKAYLFETEGVTIDIERLDAKDHLKYLPMFRVQFVGSSEEFTFWVKDAINHPEKFTKLAAHCDSIEAFHLEMENNRKYESILL